MRPFRREKSVTFDYSPVESSRDSLTPSRAEVDDDDWRSSYREERLKDLRFPSLPLSLSFSLCSNDSQSDGDNRQIRRYFCYNNFRTDRRDRCDERIFFSRYNNFFLSNSTFGENRNSQFLEMIISILRPFLFLFFSMVSFLIFENF